MNSLAVESALRTALAASAFPTETIYLGNDYQELTPESLNLVVSCGEIEHVVDTLYKATATIRVTAPALLGESSLSEMTTAINSVRSSLAASYLTAHWPTAAGVPGFAGVFQRSTKSSREDHQWVVEVEALIGLTA